MRKAVEYLKDLFEEPYNLDGNSIESDFLNIIKEVQLEAVERTCIYISNRMRSYTDEQIAMDCIEILKKEIE